MPAAQHSAKSGEHYTPVDLVERARRTMGSIDIDPATSEAANTIVRAAHVLTAEQDGLRYSWPGNVFLNAPGSCVVSDDGLTFTRCGKPTDSRCACKLVQKFWQHLLQQVISETTRAGIWIGFNTNQFQSLKTAQLMFPTCFPKQRIRYLDANLQPQSSPPHGSYITLVTNDSSLWKTFYDEFSDLGQIVAPLRFA